MQGRPSVIWFSRSGSMSKGNKVTVSKRDRHGHTELTKMSITKECIFLNVVYTHDGIFYSHKRKSCHLQQHEWNWRAVYEMK